MVVAIYLGVALEIVNVVEVEVDDDVVLGIPCHKYLYMLPFLVYPFTGAGKHAVPLGYEVTRK